MVRRTFTSRERGLPVDDAQPAVAYLFEELVGSFLSPTNLNSDDVFVFQYWPESISDSYAPNYSEHTIPGGSLPLYQYSGGGERSISFTATFTAEVQDQNNVHGITDSKYTVDVAAALARLQKYLYPRYRTGGQLGVVEAPPKLVLVMPNTNLGRDQDELLVILKGASVQYQKWFPDGTPRIATVDLEFAECIQRKVGSDQTSIKFISSQRYLGVAKRYRLSALAKPDGLAITGG